MGWGTARKPKVSNRLGIPNPREGSDGDIQVRQTGIGARLFAKLGGRWFSNKLEDNLIDDKNIFIPKVWYLEGQIESSISSYPHNEKYYLPNYINHNRILGIMFGVTTSAKSFDVWNMGGEEHGTTGYMSATSSGGSSLEKTKACRVRYNIAKNYIEIKIPHNEATDMPGEKFKIAVFFK